MASHRRSLDARVEQLLGAEGGSVARRRGRLRSARARLLDLRMLDPGRSFPGLLKRLQAVARAEPLLATAALPWRWLERPTGGAYSAAPLEAALSDPALREGDLSGAHVDRLPAPWRRLLLDLMSASSYKDLGRWRQRADCFELLLVLLPEAPFSWSLVGRVAFHEARRGAGAWLFERALELGPHISLYYYLSYGHESWWEYDEVYEATGRLFELNERHRPRPLHWSSSMRARALFSRGEHAEARRYVARAWPGRDGIPGFYEQCLSLGRAAGDLELQSSARAALDERARKLSASDARAERKRIR